MEKAEIVARERRLGGARAKCWGSYARARAHSMVPSITTD